MASGKSAVGLEVARILDWRFFDFDDEIRRETGDEVADIIRRAGEGGFRAVESRVAGRLLRRQRAVLASGGGWAAQPGHMANLPAGTLSVWLKVTPEAAVKRARSQAVERPLLDVVQPLQRARRLLARRTPYYGLARLTANSEGVSVSALAGRIARFASRDNRLSNPSPRSQS